MEPVVIDRPDSVETQAWWFLDTLTIEHRTAPSMRTVVMEMVFPVGSAPPLHVHHDLDDTWLILGGEFVLRCGDEQTLAGPGTWVSMPRGVPHTFRVVGDREGHILLVHDNARFRDLVRALGVPAPERVVPERPAFPEFDELVRVASAHDLTPVGPPMSGEDAELVLASAS